MWLQPSRGRRRGVGAPSARAPTPAVRGSDRGAWSGPSGCCGRRHQIPAALQALQLRAAAAAKSPRTVCTIRAPGRPRRSRSSAALRGASALEELWGVVGTEDRLTGVDSATPPLKRSVWEPPGSGLSWGTLHRTGGPRRHNSEPPPGDVCLLAEGSTTQSTRELAKDIPAARMCELMGRRRRHRSANSARASRRPPHLSAEPAKLSATCGAGAPVAKHIAT